MFAEFPGYCNVCLITGDWKFGVKVKRFGVRVKEIWGQSKNSHVFQLIDRVDSSFYSDPKSP